MPVIPTTPPFLRCRNYLGRWLLKTGYLVSRVLQLGWMGVFGYLFLYWLESFTLKGEFGNFSIL